MTTLLKHAVDEFEFASNGQEALAVIEASIQEANPISMIFMDMEMPGMDGYVATQNLRQRGIAIPIVAITGKTSSTDRDKCLGYGCTEFLPKPVSQEELLQAVMKHGCAEAERSSLQSKV
jgi:two-component system CheB/CheR fusion protein